MNSRVPLVVRDKLNKFSVPQATEARNVSTNVWSRGITAEKDL
jgi:hypothetical protein